MISTNIANLSKNLLEYINQAVEFNDVVNVNTDNGNVILINEEDYNGLLETLYLSSDFRVKKEILDGINTTIEECVPEEEVEW